jgi:hypothetical protein
MTSTGRDEKVQGGSDLGIVDVLPIRIDKIEVLRLTSLNRDLYFIFILLDALTLLPLPVWIAFSSVSEIGMSEWVL